DRAATPGPFCLVHRNIGVPDNFVSGAVGGDRIADHNTNARPRVNLAGKHVVSRRQRLEELFGNPDDVTRALEIVDENEELVAPEAADQHIIYARDAGLAGPQGALQAPADLPQQLVASLVTQSVVDEFEAIEIQKEYGELQLFPGS